MLRNKLSEFSQIFAVGDIHGCRDLLDNIHSKIIKASKNRAGKKTIIYLGDYVDRGPDIKGTIQTLIDFNPPHFKKIFLLGNHEQMLLNFISKNSNNHFEWIYNGGSETLESYGMNLSNYIDDSMDLTIDKKFKKKFIDIIPSTHMNFFNQLILNYLWGDYFFVHAGINPDIPLTMQERETMLWTREKHFFKPTMKYEKIIVHGHTAKERIEKFPFRINLDTGSFYSGKLSCLLIENNQLSFMDTLSA
jgi:serine/threonine protein phosphatase 1